jgi:hypothetical protein
MVIGKARLMTSWNLNFVFVYCDATSSCFQFSVVLFNDGAIVIVNGM